MVVAAHRTSVGCAQAGQRVFSPDSTITRRDVVRWRDFLPIAGRGLTAGSGLTLPAVSSAACFSPCAWFPDPAGRPLCAAPVVPCGGTPRPHYRGLVEAPAVRSPRIRWAVICITVAVLAADQVSKALAVAAAPPGSRDGSVRAGIVRNTGASFGIGTGHPVLITAVAAAVLAAAVIWLARTRGPGVALCLAV